MSVRIVAVVCLILVVYISTVSCCSCVTPPTSYQRFCSSNVVVLAFVYGTQPAGTYYKEYDALVYSAKRDTGNDIPNQPFLFVKIRTGLSSASCEYPIALGSTYLFSSSSIDFGQNPPVMWVSSCGWNKQTSDLTTYELYGIDNWICALLPPVILTNFRTA